MELALTFDDVALVPQYNDVVSRGDPVLDTWLTKGIKVGCPLVPSNMDTVIGPELALVFSSTYGGSSILHRFHKNTDIIKLIKEKYPRPAIISWGVRDWDGLKSVLTLGLDHCSIIGVCIDVAHGHGEAMEKMIRQVKETFGEYIQVIAGNVCTAGAYIDLIHAGADAIKVGVGCGAACTTRMVTGFGVPQFTAIAECSKEAEKYHVPIIADGGIRNSRDIVIALAAGASTVMMGKMFAGVQESAATKKNICNSIDGDVLHARYRGQASFDFQQEFYGECKHVPEGEAMWIPVTGDLKSLMDTLLGGIKSGLTYAGAKNINELQRKAEFVQVTHNYKQESEIRP